MKPIPKEEEEEEEEPPPPAPKQPSSTHSISPSSTLRPRILTCPSRRPTRIRAWSGLRLVCASILILIASVLSSLESIRVDLSFLSSLESTRVTASVLFSLESIRVLLSVLS
jgi:hypothetical protein